MKLLNITKGKIVMELIFRDFENSMKKSLKERFSLFGDSQPWRYCAKDSRIDIWELLEGEFFNKRISFKELTLTTSERLCLDIHNIQVKNYEVETEGDLGLLNTLEIINKALEIDRGM